LNQKKKIAEKFGYKFIKNLFDSNKINLTWIKRSQRFAISIVIRSINKIKGNQFSKNHENIWNSKRTL